MKKRGSKKHSKSVKRSRKIKQKQTWYKCSSCDYKSKYKRVLETHFYHRHDSPVWYHCYLCSQKTNSKRSLQFHIQIQHNTKAVWYWCYRCGFETKYKQSLAQHIKNSHKKASNGFLCEFCKFDTSHESSLKAHIEQKHKLLVCSVCSYTTRVKRYLSHHIRKHNQQKIKRKEKADIASNSNETNPRKDEYNNNCDHTINSTSNVCENDARQDQIDHCESKSDVPQNFSRNALGRVEYFNRNVDETEQQPFVTLNSNEDCVQENSDISLGKPEESIHVCSLRNYRTRVEKYLSTHMKLHHNKSASKGRIKERKHDQEVIKRVKRGRKKIKQNQRWYNCSFCSRKMNTKHSLQFHIRIQHNMNAVWYRCYHCGFETKYKQWLAQHIKNSHNKASNGFLCAFCKFSTSHESRLKTHVEQKHKQLVCSVCSYTTRVKRYLSHHMKLHHNKSTSKGHIKMKRKRNQEEINRKEEADITSNSHDTNSRKDEYNNNNCDHTIDLTSNVCENDAQQDQIDHCESKYDEPQNFSQNALGRVEYFNRSVDETEQQPFVTLNSNEDCVQEYIDISLGKPEESIHVCSLCNYRTRVEKYLSIHMKLHHNKSASKGHIKERKHDQEEIKSVKRGRKFKQNQTMYKCSSCNYKSKYKRVLETHFYHRHDSPVWYQCYLCGHKMNSKRSLQFHIQIQHNMKVVWYRCYHCGFETKYKQWLAQHIKNSHNKASNGFLCEFCKFTTSHESHLKTHVEQKHKLLVCSVCSYTTQVKRYLSHHMKLHHNKSTSKGHIKMKRKRNQEEINRKEKADIASNSHDTNPRKDEYNNNNCDHTADLTSKVCENDAQQDQIDHCESKSDESRNFSQNALGRVEYFNCIVDETEQQPFVTLKSNEDCVQENLNISMGKADKSIHVCSLCTYRTRVEKYLSIHMKLHHNKSASKGHDKERKRDQVEIKRVKKGRRKMKQNQRWYHCSFCSRKMNTKHSLQFHIRIQHNMNAVWYRCYHCGFETKYKQWLAQHIKNSHNKASNGFLCEFCKFNTSHESRLKTHVEQKHKLLVCSVCSYRTRVKRYLSHHMRLHHNRSTSKGHIKMKRKRNQEEINRKEKADIPSNSHDTNPRKDEYNNNNCDHTADLTSNVCENDAQQDQIDHCESKSDESRNFSQNALGRVESFNCIVDETEQQPFVTLKSNEDCVEENINISLGNPEESILVCSLCNYRTRVEKYLSIHMKLHHNKSASKGHNKERKRHQVEIKRVKKGRRKIKQNQRWYHCSFCSRKMNTKHSLQFHIQIQHNMNAVWYRCYHCGFETKYKQWLAQHIKNSHNKASNGFLCEFCKFSTSQKSRLKTHVEQKHKLLVCSVCSYTTRVKRYLSHHMRLHHNRSTSKGRIKFKRKHNQEETTRKKKADIASNSNDTDSRKDEYNKNNCDHTIDLKSNIRENDAHQDQIDHCESKSDEPQNFSRNALGQVECFNHRIDETEQQPFVTLNSNEDCVQQENINIFLGKTEESMHNCDTHPNGEDSEWYYCVYCEYKSTSLRYLECHFKHSHIMIGQAGLA